jgi:hypothetical protein
MRYLDQLVKMTQKAVDDVCRAAEAIPRGREDWSPGGAARSALSQMQELATQGPWYLPIIRDGVVPQFDSAAREAAVQTRARFDSIAKCVQQVRSSTSELCQAIASFPESRFDEEVVLPFGGGITVTMADVLSLPHWNLVYHLGQINQIQLLLGDAVMH